MFIDGTFKSAPINWYQLVNIFGFIKKKNLSSISIYAFKFKKEELYIEVFNNLKNAIELVTPKNFFSDVKIMADFGLGLRGAIKTIFDGVSLAGCFFHFCKSIWSKIKKLYLFKKTLGVNTMVLAFIIKAYPFIKEKNLENYCKKIEDFCFNLKGNYIKLYNYFYKYWRNNRLFNFSSLNDELIEKKLIM